MRASNIIKLAAYQLFTVLFWLVCTSVHAALDAPHNGSTATGCQSCHQMTSTFPKLLPPLGHSPQHLDDTLANQVCWTCHNDATASFVATHSSLTTTTSHGHWSVECWVCHNQHMQEQNRYNGSTYGKYIRRSVNRAKITGLARTGSKTVRLLGQTGPGSFADGDAPANGVCEVCHEDTSHWSGASPAGDKHFSAWRCTECHKHTGGFKPDWPDHDQIVQKPPFCATCHTNSLLALHQADATTYANCNRCHQTNNNYEFSGTLPTVYLKDSLTYHSGKDKRVFATTARCDDCHHGQFEEHVTDTGHGRLHDKISLGYDSDNDGSGDQVLACDACHFPDAIQEHVTRRDFTCSICHDASSAAAKVTAAVVKGRSSADGGTDTILFCNECHNLDTGVPNGALADKHHITRDAVAGDCTRCHVVGPGVNGPIKGACLVCHGDDPTNGTDGRFAYRHVNAPTINLATVQDIRVCFSCHLEGGQGYRAGVTPPVTPLHAWPTAPRWPGDCWNSDAYDPAGGISGLPACSANGIPGSYQGENYLQTVLGGQWSGPAGNTATDQLLRRTPGFGTFGAWYDLQGGRGGIYFQDTTVVDGSPLDTAPGEASTKKSGWAFSFLHDEVTARYTDPTTAFVTVPITVDGITREVPSLDGSGGGAKPATLGSLEVTLAARNLAGNPAMLPVGAQWRLDGGTWRDSGELLANQRERGDHRLEYRPVAGWAAPPAASVAVPGSAAATYEECPPDAAMTISGPTSLAWDSPATQIAYSAAGWLPSGGTVTWDLEPGGATGFTVISTGAASAVLEKNGTTAVGTYTFTLTATGSTCFRNSGAITITVTVTPGGALFPTVVSGEGIIGNALVASRSLGGYNTDLIRVSDSTFAWVDGSTGTIKTFTVPADGQIAANPVLASDTFPVAGAKQARIIRVDGDLFAIVCGQNLQTVRLTASGQITKASSTLIDAASNITSTLFATGNGLFVAGFFETDTRRRATLRSFAISPAGAVSWKQTYPLPAGLDGSYIYDLAQVSGEVYALFHSGDFDPDGNFFGVVRTLGIDANGNFTSLHSYSFPGLNGAGGSILRVGDGKFALACKAEQATGFIRTLAITASGAIVAPGLINRLAFAHGELQVDSGARLVRLSGKVYVALGNDIETGNMGFTTWTITSSGIIVPRKIDSLKVGMADTRFNLRLVPVAGDVYAFTGGGDMVYTFTMATDADSDGVTDGSDNCPGLANGDQAPTPTAMPTVTPAMPARLIRPTMRTGTVFAAISTTALPWRTAIKPMPMATDSAMSATPVRMIRPTMPMATASAVNRTTARLKRILTRLIRIRTRWVISATTARPWPTKTRSISTRTDSVRPAGCRRRRSSQPHRPTRRGSISPGPIPF